MFIELNCVTLQGSHVSLSAVKVNKIGSQHKTSAAIPVKPTKKTPLYICCIEGVFVVKFSQRGSCYIKSLQTRQINPQCVITEYVYRILAKALYCEDYMNETHEKLHSGIFKTVWWVMFSHRPLRHTCSTVFSWIFWIIWQQVDGFIHGHNDLLKLKLSIRMDKKGGLSGFEPDRLV